MSMLCFLKAFCGPFFLSPLVIGLHADSPFLISPVLSDGHQLQIAEGAEIETGMHRFFHVFVSPALV